MTEITCKRCHQAKPADEFGDDIRTETGKARTCRACKKPGGGRSKGGGSAVKKQKAAEAAPAAAVEALPAQRIDLEPGFGMSAYVDGNRLVLEQANNAGSVENVTLSRTEAKVLFAQFAEWAA